MVRLSSAALLAGAMGLVLATVSPATAGGWRRGYHHHGHGDGAEVVLGVGLGILGLGVAAAALAPPRPRVYYAPPPPVFYAPPPPVVYAPPPVVYAPPPPPVVWHDPVVDAVPASDPYRGPDGRYCREYQSNVIIGGVPRPAYGTACLEPDGTWRVVR